MSKMLEQMNKLRGRSWRELLFRGNQAFAALSERHGLSMLSKLPTDAELLHLLDVRQFSQLPGTTESLLSHFRADETSIFFAAFDDPAATIEELRNQFGNESRHLLEEAELITSGRFHLLGFRDLDFGDPIDWHLEPVSGMRSPLVHWSQIDELDSEASGDKKIVWELNRHQYFATLGRAFWLTGNEIYAETFARHLEQWMDRNPPKLGLNWVSSLEVGFRAISWIWALHFFRNATSLTAELYTRALKHLYLHARHLETYLSTYSSPNTHLTGEALGLYYLGTCLSLFRDASRWRELGQTILIDQLSLQVLEDGVYFERATYYHRYTTEFYTHFVILSERNRAELPEIAKTKLQSLLDHMMFITRPDGTTPLIGDDDGGRVVLLDEQEPNDFRSLLSTGAVLFSRGDYKYVAREAKESTLWLLGPEKFRLFDELERRPPQSESRAFPDGGIYVMRDDWTSDANYLLLDCGPHGVLGCGHAHADVLSFDLAARGRTLLVDPGTYTYTGSKELRDYFRSSAAHNTLTIDGVSSSVPDGPFSWKETSNASIIAWKSTPRFDFFSGEHDGYMRLNPSPATHTRSVLFLKKNYWVMRDLVRTEGAHLYEMHFHFAADSHASLEKSNGTIDSPIESMTGNAGVQITSFGDGGEWHVEEGWVSSCYGERTRAQVFNFSVKATGSREFISFLIPRRVNERPAQVYELEALGGHAFEIMDAKSRDVLLVGNGELIESQLITSDFKWAWARFTEDDATLEELVLIDGRRFSFNNHEVVNSPARIDYAVARRVDDKLNLEIDGTISDVGLPVDELVAATIPVHPGSRL